MSQKILARVVLLGLVSWFTDVAVPAAPDEVESDRQQSVQVIDLCHPWSLISFNVAPPDPSLHAVLTAIDGLYESVQGFECGEGARSWVAGRPINDLWDMEPYYGYWLEVSEPDLLLSISGAPMPGGTVMGLCPDWNLLSYVPSVPDTIAHALETILADCEEVFEYVCDGIRSWDSQKPPFLNDLYCLKPGHGYWVKVIVATTLTYPSDGYSCDAPEPAHDAPAVSIPLTTGERTAPATPTPWWSDYWSVSSTAGGVPLEAGNVISAYDGDGILCGEAVVTASGEYLIHVYGDDPNTLNDEGAVNGDWITLSLNDTCDVVVADPWTERASQETDVDFCEDVSCACDCHADPQCDGVTNVLDVVLAVGVAFRSGAAIVDPNPLCPYDNTDVDCSGFTNVIDVVKFVNVGFRSGDPADEFCNSCP